MLHEQYSKFFPNYGKLYPGVTLTPEQLEAAKKSDRQIKHFEYDLKTGKPIYRNCETGALTDKDDPKAIIADRTDGREISLETLLESGEKAVTDAIDIYANPLDAVLKKERYEELYNSLKSLAPEERKLIDALFFKNMTEKEYAKSIGCTQSNVNQMKHRAFTKLRKIISKK
jgi:RNA polymerase sigma factor (sigma-70 family)